MSIEYEKEAEKHGTTKEKIRHWWTTLTPEEREGMRKLALVGCAGGAIASVIQPEITPAFVGTCNLYIRPDRYVRSALSKLAHIHRKKVEEVV